MPSTSAPGLRPDDLLACQQLLRDGSRSFYAASRLLPRTTRHSAAVVYGFCRIADDLIDSGHASRWTLVHLCDRLSTVYGGDEPTDAVDRALQAVVRHYEIPRVIFDTLLEGFSWEIEGRQYETLSEVRAYSVRVAATVGLAMSFVMHRRDPETLERACQLGVAMQLTNIARDVGEDARAGRLYLPRAWMREAGIDPDEWMGAPEFTPPLGSVVHRVLAEAERLYTAAESGIARLPLRTRTAIRAAGMIYADIGRAIAANGFDSVSRRAVTSGRRKLSLVLRALATARKNRVIAAGQPPLPEASALVQACHDLHNSQPPAPGWKSNGDGRRARQVLQETT